MQFEGSAAERGARVRGEVLGSDFGAAAAARDRRIVGDFEELALEVAWGQVWARDGIDRRMRSALTIAVLITLGREAELELHVRAALRNGLTVEEITEVFMHCSVYCGMPLVNSALRLAEPILAAALDEGIVDER